MTKQIRQQIIGMLLLCQPAITLALEPYVTGLAYDVDSGVALYREVHSLDIPSRRHIVDYYNNAGTVIVHKEVNYDPTLDSSDEQQYKLNVPAFTQLDLRDGTVMGAEIVPDGYRISHAEKNKKQKEKTFAYKPALVIDVGFDHYIRQHWEVLLAGEEIPLLFALPQYLSTLSMKIRQVPAGKHGLPVADPDWVYFRARAANALMRIVVPDILLAYHREKRELMIFQGISNISADNGDKQHVRIEYQYQDR